MKSKIINQNKLLRLLVSGEIIGRFTGEHIGFVDDWYKIGYVSRLNRFAQDAWLRKYLKQRKINASNQ